MSGLKEQTPVVETNQSINRREVLKVLTAASGAFGVAAFLPAEWSKPAIQAGVIPAHAQSSQPPLTISNLTAQVPVETPPGITGYGEFDWDDPSGEVVCGSAQFSAAIQGCLSSVSIECLGVGNNAGGLSGYLNFAFDTQCPIRGGEMLCLTMTVGGRVSNQTCGPITLQQSPAH